MTAVPLYSLNLQDASSQPACGKMEVQEGAVVNISLLQPTDGVRGNEPAQNVRLQDVWTVLVVVRICGAKVKVIVS